MRRTWPLALALGSVLAGLALSVAGCQTPDRDSRGATRVAPEPAQPARSTPDRWTELRARANGGDAGAMFALARGLPEPAERREWMERAAESGALAAHYFVGVKHLFGSDGERNPEEAYRWFQAGAQGGSRLCRRAIEVWLPEIAGAQALESGRQLQAAGDQAGALQAFELAADQGNGLAMVLAADLCSELIPGEAGEKRAKELYQRASTTWHAEAVGRVAARYLTGDGVPRYPRYAVTDLGRAARLGDRAAARRLADLHRRGDVVPRDPLRADRWEAVAQGLEGPCESHRGGSPAAERKWLGGTCQISAGGESCGLLTWIGVFGPRGRIRGAWVGRRALPADLSGLPSGTPLVVVSWNPLAASLGALDLFRAAGTPEYEHVHERWANRVGVVQAGAPLGPAHGYLTRVFEEGTRVPPGPVEFEVNCLCSPELMCEAQLSGYSPARNRIVIAPSHNPIEAVLRLQRLP